MSETPSVTMQDILARTKPVLAEATICLDGELLLEHDRISTELDGMAGWESSSLSDVDPRIEVRSRLADLEQRIRAASQTFLFRSVGDKTNSDLLAAHPSPKNDQGEPLYAFDPTTYPVALIAASAVEPVMTTQEAEQLFDVLNLDQRNQLFGAAFRANQRSVDIPFSSSVSAKVAPPEPK